MLKAFDALLAVVERISRGFARAAGVLLVLMVLLIIVEIVMRRLFSISLGLSFEYSGYLFGISASWAFAYALFEKAHIRIDAAYMRFSEKPRLALDVVAMAAFAAFAVMAAQAAFGVVAESLSRDTVANTPLHTPMWIPQTLWVAGWLWFAFATLLLLARMLIALALGDAATARRWGGSSTIDEQIEQESAGIEELKS